MQPLVAFTDSVMMTARWHNVAILDYRGAWELRHIDEIAKLYREIFTEHATATCITVAHSGTPMSNPSVNGKAAQLVKSLGAKVPRSVVVVEERGALASMLRGVIRAVNIMGGNGSVGVASTVDEGVRLILPHVATADGNKVSELQMVGVIRRLLRDNVATLPLPRS